MDEVPKCAYSAPNGVKSYETVADNCFNFKALETLSPSVINDLKLSHGPVTDRVQLRNYLIISLASQGFNVLEGQSKDFFSYVQPHLDQYKAASALSINPIPPVDKRIQDYLNETFIENGSLENVPKLPRNPLNLDIPRVCREISLPADASEYNTGYGVVHRTQQGILFNPSESKRSIFKVSQCCESDDFIVPGDKILVSKAVFKNLLNKSLDPPNELMKIPYITNTKHLVENKKWLGLYTRPLIRPGVPGCSTEKSHEVRLLVPASLAPLADFAESLFGNAGNPILTVNDAALDAAHWTGTTSCIIIAPQLTKVTKKELGVVHISEATERQIRDGMFYENEDELYNNGNPFFATLRDSKGVFVTIIASSYPGYIKKVFKSHMSMSATMMGSSTIEHSSGVINVPSYSFQDIFHSDDRRVTENRICHFSNVIELMKDHIIYDEKLGYAVDKTFSNIIYIPENASASLKSMSIMYNHPLTGESMTLKLKKNHQYILPNGYRFRIEKQNLRQSFKGNWHIVGSPAAPSYIHMPYTASGTGKSEVSKCLYNNLITAPFLVDNLEESLDAISEIIDKDYSNRFKPAYLPPSYPCSRPFLSTTRSLGSVIKLFTPSPMYTDKYNKWVKDINPNVKALAFLLKCVYKAHWGLNWKSHFAVDFLNGDSAGQLLKLDSLPIQSSLIRVGSIDGTERVFKLRQDFVCSYRVQQEDDLTASTTVALPMLEKGSQHPHLVGFNSDYQASAKFMSNTEKSLFKLSNSALVPGADPGIESDFATLANNLFACNFEPLDKHIATEMSEDCVTLSQFTMPMVRLISTISSTCEENEALPLTSHENIDENLSWVSPTNPRILKDGSKSSNPRYLQSRLDQYDPLPKYLCETQYRIKQMIPTHCPVVFPINMTIFGRKCYSDARYLWAFSCYAPIHYQQLPELMADLVFTTLHKYYVTPHWCELSKRVKISPHSLSSIYDLNHFFISQILTGEPIFSVCSGSIGSKYYIENDIHLLFPEVFSRMKNFERCPENLIKSGSLEQIQDFEYEGETIPASILGYRVTSDFSSKYLGRVFDHPENVFPEDMLKPELQDIHSYARSIKTVVELQRKSARIFISDNSISEAIPPIKALLYILAYGSYEGMTRTSPEFRQMFTKSYLLNSDWYKLRLDHQQTRHIRYWKKSIDYIKNWNAQYGNTSYGTDHVNGPSRLAHAQNMLEYVSSEGYRNHLVGSTGYESALFRE